MMNDESIKDTLMDVAGYSLIARAMQDNVWNDNPGEINIYSLEYRKAFYEELDALFIKKLKAYGTKDLQAVDQVTQRQHEKLYRIENLLKGRDTEGHKFRIKLHEEGLVGILPPQKAGDAGFDLVASEDMIIGGFGEAPVNIPCGFSAKIPAGYWAEIRPRSSTPTKFGVLVHASVMDEGYTGPWFVIAHSLSGEPVKVAKGTRLAQCVLHKAVVPPLEFVSELPQTDRGDTGFGSSGLKV